MAAGARTSSGVEVGGPPTRSGRHEISSTCCRRRFVFSAPSWRCKRAASVMVPKSGPRCRGRGVWSQECIGCHNTLRRATIMPTTSVVRAPSYQGKMSDRVLRHRLNACGTTIDETALAKPSATGSVPRRCAAREPAGCTRCCPRRLTMTKLDSKASGRAQDRCGRVTTGRAITRLNRAVDRRSRRKASSSPSVHCARTDRDEGAVGSAAPARSTARCYSRVIRGRGKAASAAIATERLVDQLGRVATSSSAVARRR